MRRFYCNSLRDRLILLIFVCMVPVLGMTLYNAIEDRRLAILYTRADMLKVSQLAATHQGQVIQNAQQLLLILAKFMPVRTPVANECTTLLSDILKSYSIYDNIGVVKPNGEVVCSALPHPRYINQDGGWLPQTLTNRTFTVAKYAPNSSSQSSIICAYPIINKQNQVESTVFLILHSSWLKEIGSKILLSEGSTLSIFDRNGLAIAQYPPPEMQGKSISLHRSIIKDMLMAGKDVAKIRHVDGSEHLYIPIAKDNVVAASQRYIAAIGISQLDPFAHTRRTLKRNLLGLALVTAIAIFLAWVGSELFWIRPLKKLVNATARIAKGDLSARTNLPDRHEELSQLARTFDFMANSLERQLSELQQAESEVRQLNQTLEQRVNERTAQLEFINQELESFSYSVSHDLRAPLRHITGFVKALKTNLEPTGALQNDKIAHYLSVIDSSSQKMGLLIDGLLRLSRIGQKPLTKQRVNIRALVDTAVALVIQHPDNSDNVEFTIAELPILEGDPILLQQVFSNLIDNAVKFSRDRHPAEITIGSQPDGTIFVRDNGIGFNMDYADKLFTAFGRLHSPQDFPGTGIGLAIVLRIINRHGGTIWFESQPNIDTTFYFKI